MKGQNKRNVVMIADDDMFVRKVIASALQEVADIVEVSDGAMVETIYRERMPDVIFLDIHLPNFSGLELIQRLYACDPHAYIVMLSADSSQTNVLTAAQKGIKAFLTKPFDRKRLLDVFYLCPTLGEAPKA